MFPVVRGGEAPEQANPAVLSPRDREKTLCCSLAIPIIRRGNEGNHKKSTISK